MRLVVPQSLMSIEVASALGSLLPPWPRCFQRTSRSSRDTGPQTIANLGSSSLELDVLFRALFVCHPPATRKSRAPLMGFRPSSRRKCLESTHGRPPTVYLRSVFSVSHALDGLLLHTLRGLVSSHSHVQDSHSRGFPLSLAAVSFDAPFPHVVSGVLLLTGCPASARSSRPPSGL